MGTHGASAVQDFEASGAQLGVGKSPSQMPASARRSPLWQPRPWRGVVAGAAGRAARPARNCRGRPRAGQRQRGRISGLAPASPRSDRIELAVAPQVRDPAQIRRALRPEGEPLASGSSKSEITSSTISQIGKPLWRRSGSFKPHSISRRHQSTPLAAARAPAQNAATPATPT